MSCNRIDKAITNRMPPKCFNCCVWDMYDELKTGYCWLLERTTSADDKPEDCPLVKGICARCFGTGTILPSVDASPISCPECDGHKVKNRITIHVESEDK